MIGQGRTRARLGEDWRPKEELRRANQGRSRLDGTDPIILPFEFGRINDMVVHVGSLAKMAFHISIYGKCKS